jgi:CheY-like chemotaxis protein
MVDKTDRPQPRILVVEDYGPTRDALAELLVEAGFSVETAVSGSEAYAKAVRERPDLILMDLSLPGVDGTEATQMIRADARTKNIPVLALSGHKRKEKAALEAGCDAFVSKPFDTAEVEQRIRALLRGKKRG